MPVFLPPPPLPSLYFLLPPFLNTTVEKFRTVPSVEVEGREKENKRKASLSLVTSFGRGFFLANVFLSRIFRASVRGTMTVAKKATTTTEGFFFGPNATDGGVRGSVIVPKSRSISWVEGKSRCFYSEASFFFAAIIHTILPEEESYDIRR